MKNNINPYYILLLIAKALFFHYHLFHECLASDYSVYSDLSQYTKDNFSLFFVYIWRYLKDKVWECSINMVTNKTNTPDISVLF